MSRWQRPEGEPDGEFDARLDRMRWRMRVEAAWSVVEGDWNDEYRRLFSASDWPTMRRRQAERRRHGLPPHVSGMAPLPSHEDAVRLLAEVRRESRDGSWEVGA